MARLAIAKGFLAEYAKLDKDVQRAVDVAIATVRPAPAPRAAPGEAAAQPGRPDPPAPGGQPLARRRAGSRKRTDGDTYCLVTVLPQDQAYAYAAGHRFSVNQALGVLEARDEEAIQQLRPALADRSTDDRQAVRRRHRRRPGPARRRRADPPDGPAAGQRNRPGSAASRRCPTPSTPRCTRWPAG